MVVTQRLTIKEGALVWNEWLIDDCRSTIEIPLYGGSTFWVDTRNHYRVIAWSATPVMGMDVLEVVFGQEWATAVRSVISRRQRASDHILAPPTLKHTWRKLATNVAIKKWATPALPGVDKFVILPAHVLKYLDATDPDRKVLEQLEAIIRLRPVELAEHAAES